MDVIEIAKECCSYPVKVNDYHWCGEGEFIFNESGLNEFAQRIEQPLQHRINELTFDVAHQQQKIEQLRNQIADISEMAFLGLNTQVRKALKELCDALEQTK